MGFLVWLGYFAIKRKTQEKKKLDMGGSLSVDKNCPLLQGL